MTLSLENLGIARELILKDLSEHIKSITNREIMRELKIVFHGGFILYIKYNDYGEYGYQLMFSQRKDDYVRFDNYDKDWEVSTKPHHYHSLKPKEVTESPMIGDPKNDIPILDNFIREKLKL